MTLAYPVLPVVGMVPVALPVHDIICKYAIVANIDFCRDIDVDDGTSNGLCVCA